MNDVAKPIKQNISRHKPGRKVAKQARFLAHAVYLEEAGPPKALSVLVWVLLALIGGAVFWSASARIEESAVTTGTVIPSASVQLVQHLEGGIVREIPVREGQVVNAGDLLLRLDEKSARAELDRMETRHAALAVKAERLRAFAENRPANFTMVNEAKFADLIRDQKAILALQVTARDSQQKVVEAQIADKKTEKKNFERQRQTLRKDLSLITEELEMRNTLLKKGLMSRIVYLDVQRTANRTRGDLRDLEGSILQAQQAINEAKSRLIEQEVRLRNEALTEMGVVAAELAELSRAKKQAEDRVNRLDIVSPVHGAVQKVVIKTVGGVVAPGSVVMEVVPLDDDLIVETKIATQDVGHVSKGQDAVVKVSAFDFARYGGVPGKITKISATTFMDEDGEPYYKGIIKLSSNFVGDPDRGFIILPGMTIQADIRTGNRTVMEYLLAPLYRAINNAFRER